MKVLRWLWDYWYIPFMVLAALGGLILVVALRGAGRSVTNPLEAVSSELRVIEAGRVAREDRINRGEEEALKAVQDRYSKQLESLDEKAASQIRQYESDPVLLARALERASRS